MPYAYDNSCLTVAVMAIILFSLMAIQYGVRNYPIPQLFRYAVGLLAVTVLLFGSYLLLYRVDLNRLTGAILVASSLVCLTIMTFLAKPEPKDAPLP